MKSLLFCILVISFAACSSTFEKLDESQSDPELKRISAQLINIIVTGEVDTTGKIESQMSDIFKNTFTPEKRKKIYQQNQKQFGALQSLDYVQTWTSKMEDAKSILRYKAKFSENKKKMEIRVIFNQDRKITGLWLKPWVDVLM